MAFILHTALYSLIHYICSELKYAVIFNYWQYNKNSPTGTTSYSFAQAGFELRSMGPQAFVLPTEPNLLIPLPKLRDFNKE